MSHTHVTNFVHIVFSTKDRRDLIPSDQHGNLWAHLHGIAKNEKVPVLAIGGTANHVHLLLSIPPTQNLSKIICDLKASSLRVGWAKPASDLPGRKGMPPSA